MRSARRADVRPERTFLFITAKRRGRERERGVGERVLELADGQGRQTGMGPERRRAAGRGRG